MGGVLNKNLFDFDSWTQSLWASTRGTHEIYQNSIKFTATENTATTVPYLTSQDTEYKIPVIGNKRYIISWTTDIVNSGRIILHENGVEENKINALNEKINNSYSFVTSSDTTFLTVRLYIANSGDSLTYSNIMIRDADIIDDTYEPYTPSIDTRLTNAENDILKHYGTLSTISKNLINPSKITSQYVLEDGSLQADSTGSLSDFIRIDGKPFVVTCAKKTGGDSIRVNIYDEDKNFIKRIAPYETEEVKVNDSSIAFVRVNINNSKHDLSTLQLEFGTVATPYEPYKPSIDTRLTDVENNLISNNNDTALASSTLGISSYYCKNIFDYAKWESSINSVDKGTFEKHGDGITISANAYDAYTSQYAASHTNICKIPVKPNTKYILSWESDNDNDGKVYIFKNALPSSYVFSNNKYEKSLDFETNSDTTFITVRFGVMYAGESITYSNIMIREADITDNTYEPYVPSVNERLVEVENGVEQNTADILKIARSTSIVRIGAVGWYRIAEIDKLLTRRSMFLRILRGYTNIAPEAYLLYLNFAYGDSEDPMTFSDCNIIDAFCHNTKINKIRIVMPSKVGESSTFYIDIHYNASTSESVSAEIFGESAPPGSSVNPVNLINLTKIDTLPDDCLTKEYTLGNRDIFDRLTALETALAQTSTTTE